MTGFEMAMQVIDEAVLTADEVLSDVTALAELADAYKAVGEASRSLAVLRTAIENKMDEHFNDGEKKRVAGDHQVEKQFSRSEKWDHMRTLKAVMEAEGLILVNLDGEMVTPERLATYLGASASWLKGKLKEAEIEPKTLVDGGPWRVRWSVNPAPVLED